MKRYFALALVALFLVPVLAIGAAAAEIYEFEFFERPAVLSDGFDFSFMEGYYFACPMELPEGFYVFSVSSPSLSFVSSPAEVRYVSDPNVIEFPFCYFDLVYEDRIFQSGLVLQEDFTLFICPYFDDRYTIKAERVGDLPGSSVTSGDFMAVFEPVADQISVRSAVSVLAYGSGGCVGMGFGWWGIRKGVRALMAAFRSGRIKL